MGPFFFGSADLLSLIPPFVDKKALALCDGQSYSEI
jgi:hypothetical protein